MAALPRPGSFRDLIEDIISDLGGRDVISTGELQLICRAAMLCAETERMEALSERKDAAFDINEYAVMTNCLGRVLKLLGLSRRQRPVAGHLEPEGYRMTYSKRRRLHQEHAHQIAARAVWQPVEAHSVHGAR